MQNRILHIIIVVAVTVLSANAQRYEAWLDGDYNRRTVTTYTSGDIVGSIDVSSLTPGLHYYNIRMQDAQGLWGTVGRYLFLLTEAVRPERISYWIDNDTLGTVQQPVSGASVELTISVANQGPGTHAFNCRLQGTNGQWTQVYSYDFVIASQQDTLTHEPVTAEYFFDNDPGYGKGYPLQQVSSDTLHFVLSIEGLKAGAHTLYVRSADDGGIWSGTASRPLYVSAKRQNQFVAMEYFFDDDDPGVGQAIPLTDFSVGLDKIVSTLPTEGLQAGSHQLNVRGRRANGLWSAVTSRAFLIIAIEPVEPFAEYFFDNDPGYGKGHAVGHIETGTNHIAIDIEGLSHGAHVLYLRSRDENGQWSTTTARPLFVQKKHDDEFVRLEYFFDDTDPGHGNAMVLSGLEKGMQSVVSSLSVEGLSPGTHLLNVRGMDASGLWSSVASRSFLVIAVQPAMPFVEYFFDEDPGYGKGIAIMDTEAGTHQIAIDLDGLTPGAHLLYVRSRNEAGQWSVTVSRPLYVYRHADIVALEYFFDDNDPGRGKATNIPLPAGKNDQIAFEIKLDGLAVGDHLLNVRTKDSRGHWSAVMQEAFQLTRSTGINGVEGDGVPSAVFTLSGYKTEYPQHGINIIRRKDGNTYKQVTK